VLGYTNLLSVLLAHVAGYCNDLVAFLGFCHDLHLHSISAEHWLDWLAQYPARDRVTKAATAPPRSLTPVSAVRLGTSDRKL
jgi:hypothetical protein